MNEDWILIGVVALVAIFGADLLRSFSTSLFWLILAGGVIVGISMIFFELF